MRIRSFIIAYALVLAILLFADRRPGPTPEGRYSHVVDLTDGQSATAPHAVAPGSRTRIIAPAALIPGTWAAGEIPAGRLVAPLVVMDLKATLKGSPQISLDDIAAWESRHGMIPQGAVIAIRRAGTRDNLSATALSTTPFPIARDAAEFLMEARYTIGFAVDAPVNLTSDRTLAQQLALHGSYVVEGTARFTSLPATGSLIIVAPAKNKHLESHRSASWPWCGSRPVAIRWSSSFFLRHISLRNHYPSGGKSMSAPHYPSAILGEQNPQKMRRLSSISLS